MDKDTQTGITGVMELLGSKELAAFHRATISLLAETAPESVAACLVKESVRLLKGSFGYFLVPDGQGLRIAASKGLVKARKTDTNAERVARTRIQALVVEGQDLNASLAGQSPPPKSLVYHPLAREGQLVGVLCVGCYPDTFGVKEVRALDLLGPPAALVLAKAWLHKKYALVLHMQQILARGPLDDTFARFALALKEVMAFDFALLLFYNPGTTTLTVAHSWSEEGSGEWVGRQVRSDASFHAQKLAVRKEAVITASSSDMTLADARWLAEAGAKSGLVLPLVSYDASIGVFSMWSRKRHALGEDQLDLAKELANPLALAVENSRLFAKVEAAKKEWESTFDAMHEAVWIVDQRNRVKRFNTAFRDALGLDNRALVDAPLPAVLELKEDSLIFDRKERERGQLERVIEHTKLGGVAEVVGTHVRAKEGAPWTVFVARDVTATREMDVRLQQSGRLAALGQLAASVAHQINNPLAYILSNLHRIEELGTALVDGQSDEPEALASELRTLSGESLEGVARVQRIVYKLQAYARGKENADRPFSLNDLIDFCLTLLSATMHRRAQIVISLGELPPLHADMGSLTQVIINLLVNAAHSLDPASRERNSIEIHTSFKEEKYHVGIRCLGAGVGDSQPARREPTMADRFGWEEGALGLASALHLLEEFGGEVDVVAEPDGVTSYKLVIPRQVRAEQKRKRSPSSPPETVPRGRVLIIDDELYVRRALSRMLRTHHDVELAPDGPTALKLLESGAVFDVILCDVVMPGMSGIVFHEQMSERWPELAGALVFVTGGVFTPEAEEKLQSGPNPVMRKPVEPSDLLNAVAAVISKRQVETV